MAVGDFVLAHDRHRRPGAIASVSGSGNAYTVTVSGVSGTGTLGLNLVDDDSILGMGGNPLGGIGAGNGNFTGQTYNVTDITPPTAQSINRHNAAPTNAKSVAIRCDLQRDCDGRRR